MAGEMTRWGPQSSTNECFLTYRAQRAEQRCKDPQAYEQHLRRERQHEQQHEQATTRAAARATARATARTMIAQGVSKSETEQILHTDQQQG